MKVGDFVGWADTWSDETGCDMVGLVIERSFDGEYFDVLSYLGKIMIEIEKEEIVVMFKGKEEFNNENR